MIKKILAFIFLIGSLCAINGCVTVSTYTHERVDLEMKGNKGYLVGNVPQDSSSTEKTDRKTLQFDITLPCCEGKESIISDETEKPQDQSSVCPTIKEEKTSTILNPQQPEPKESKSSGEKIK